MEANLKHMDPPLSNNEVQQLIKSVNRKGYDKYRCKDAPINSVCQSGLCRTKRFGVGYGEEEMPVLGSLTKYTSNPPQWFLDVGEARIELKTEQLYSPNLFALACLDQANLIVPIPKPKDWKQHFLKPMMTNLQEVEPLESLDPTNELTGLLQDWTTNRQSARTMDDIFNKLPFTEEGFTYFRMDDFFAFCKKNNWDQDKTKTGNLIKRLENVFVDEVRIPIKKQYPRLIKIKTMTATANTELTAASISLIWFDCCAKSKLFLSSLPSSSVCVSDKRLMVLRLASLAVVDASAASSAVGIRPSSWLITSAPVIITSVISSAELVSSLLGSGSGS